jgi:hypothetical protein
VEPLYALVRRRDAYAIDVWVELVHADHVLALCLEIMCGLVGRHTGAHAGGLSSAAV